MLRRYLNYHTRNNFSSRVSFYKLIVSIQGNSVHRSLGAPSLENACTYMYAAEDCRTITLDKQLSQHVVGKRGCMISRKHQQYNTEAIKQTYSPPPPKSHYIHILPLFRMSSFMMASIVRFLNPVIKSRNKMASSTSNNANNHQPTLQDVLSVKKCFLKVVPIELVDQIISFAEYWPHNTIKLAEGTIVRNNGEELCLQSQPLPGTFIPESETEGVDIGGVCVRTLIPARKVVFRIWSHDQGWSSSNPGRGGGLSVSQSCSLFTDSI
jgi:hypothetical protein